MGNVYRDRGNLSGDIKVGDWEKRGNHGAISFIWGRNKKLIPSDVQSEFLVGILAC